MLRHDVLKAVRVLATKAEAELVRHEVVVDAVIGAISRVDHAPRRRAVDSR
jgi:hypothetical protein